jgi:hypothetical protein
MPLVQREAELLSETNEIIHLLVEIDGQYLTMRGVSD